MSDFSTVPTKSSFSNTTDYIRMYIGNKFAKVTPTVLASVISSLVASSVAKDVVRKITASGSLLISDNVLLGSGTITVTMPKPSTAWDAANNQSNSFTIGQYGSGGTLTIDPYDTETFDNGDGSPASSYTLSGGAAVTFVTDGTNWFVKHA